MLTLDPISTPSLGRYVKSADGYDIASYCIESDDLVNIKEIEGVKKFIIPIRDYSAHMFREQRFYKGTYPELDEKILDYIEYIIIGSESNEDTIEDAQFQARLQGAGGAIGKSDDIAMSEPEIAGIGKSRQVKKDVGVSKGVLREADYKCQVDPNHLTFLNKIGHQYMEGHHLIPCTPSNAERFWKECGANIDCPQNIVCICPTCHRQIHYGSSDAREKVLRKLYNIKYEDLRKIGINLSFDDLLSLYP